MGNLFSTTPSPPTPQRTYPNYAPQTSPIRRNYAEIPYSYPTSQPQRENVVHSHIHTRPRYEPRLTETQDSNRYASEQRNQRRRTFLLAECKKFNTLKKKILLHNSVPDQSEVSTVTLNNNNLNYNQAMRRFMKTTHAHFVTKIEQVFNPYLMAFYLLRKAEYTIIYRSLAVNEELWFHGTKRQNINGICKNNFNWRMHGTAKGNIFGKGVSFSPISHYSSNYGDKTVTKVMILAQVLSCQSCLGDGRMVIPPYLNSFKKVRYDTSKKADEKVCVKYYDDEYYPQYIIHYQQKQIVKKVLPM